eukprot:gene23317-biopygen4314
MVTPWNSVQLRDTGKLRHTPGNSVVLWETPPHYRKLRHTPENSGKLRHTPGNSVTLWETPPHSGKLHFRALSCTFAHFRALSCTPLSCTSLSCTFVPMSSILVSTTPAPCSRHVRDPRARTTLQSAWHTCRLISPQEKVKTSDKTVGLEKLFPSSASVSEGLRRSQDASCPGVHSLPCFLPSCGACPGVQDCYPVPALVFRIATRCLPWCSGLLP